MDLGRFYYLGARYTERFGYVFNLFCFPELLSYRLEYLMNLRRWNIPVSDIVVSNVASYVPIIPASIFVSPIVSEPMPIETVEVECDVPIYDDGDPYDFCLDDASGSTDLPPDASDSGPDNACSINKRRKTSKSTTSQLPGYVCSDCGKSFVRNIFLTEHVRYFHQKLAYQCECGKQLQTLSAVRRHQKLTRACTVFDTVSIA